MESVIILLSIMVALALIISVVQVILVFWTLRDCTKEQRQDILEAFEKLPMIIWPPILKLAKYLDGKR